jgi:preprotein translocase subunit SecG
VFGARGASNFLSKTTKWLAIIFFTLSMGMAMYASRQAARGPAKADLGVMARQPVPTVPAQQVPAVTPAAPPAPSQSK